MGKRLKENNNNHDNDTTINSAITTSTITQKGFDELEDMLINLS